MQAMNAEEAAGRSADTGAAWITGCFYALRSVIVFLCVRLLGMEASTGTAVAIGAGYLVLAVVFFHSFVPRQRPQLHALRLRTVRWGMAYLALAGCSLAWGVAASPATSLVYWTGLVTDVATVLVLLRRGAPDGVAVAMMKGFIAGACSLAAGVWFLPAQPDLRLGDQQFLNTNQIGNLCAYALLFLQYLAGRGEKRRLAALLLALTLLRSLSKTTLVAFVVCEAFLILRDQSMSRAAKRTLVVGALVAAVAFSGLFAAYYTVYTNAGNQAETFTGRTVIWLYALEHGFERPLLGNGFDSMWKVAPPFGNEFFEARHAENEILQQFYAYGMAGVLLLAGLYGSLWRAARRLPPGRLRMIVLAILIYVLVRGLAEAEPFDLLLPLWLVVLLASLVSANALERAPRQGRVALPAPGGLPHELSADCNF